MINILENLSFILERLNWLSILDILLVTVIFFGIFLLLRDTQAVALLRGVVLLIVIIAIVTRLQLLPAFSWLVGNTLPTLLLAIPVIFAPEIRRALERIGRASSILASSTTTQGIQETIDIVVQACAQLSTQKHGALIVMQRLDGLQEYTETGIILNAELTSKLILQIFYPNTPLHDGAVILAGETLIAASCVMPLAAGNIQVFSPDRTMGLRHRAAIGTSEVTDAVSVVVSEETGMISVAYGGRIIRRLDKKRLGNILTAFYHPLQPQKGLSGWLRRVFGFGEGGSK